MAKSAPASSKQKIEFNCIVAAQKLIIPEQGELILT